MTSLVLNRIRTGEALGVRRRSEAETALSAARDVQARQALPEPKRCRAPLATAVQNRHSTFHACRQDSVATCAGTSSQHSRNLLCHGEHLFASAPLPGQNTTGCAASGITQSRSGFRLAVGSLGCFFESLPLHRPLSGRSGYGRKPVPNAWPVARKDRKVGQQTRRRPKPQSLA